MDILKLGYTLPNLAIICLHQSIDAKLYPFKDGDKDLLQKIREDVVGGPFIVFTRRALVDEIFVRKSANKCQSILGIDASQLYSYTVCQPMPTCFYTHWDFESETRKFAPRQSKTRSIENMVMSQFQRTRRECEIESFFKTDRHNKMDCFSADEFYSQCNPVIEAMVCFYHFCTCQICVPLSLKRLFKVVARKESSMHCDDSIYKIKASRILKCGSAIVGDCTKQPIVLNNISENTFLTGVHLQLSNF